MTPIEFIIIVIVLVLIIVLIYFYFEGSSGRVSARRPVESRVDEYLDRKFEDLIEEWSLVTLPGVKRFREQHTPRLNESEGRLSSLKDSEREVKGNLDALEARLAALEKEFAEGPAPRREDK
jgi:hypothetical protein